MLHRDTSAIRLSGEHDRHQAAVQSGDTSPLSASDAAQLAAWYARYALDRLADDPGVFHPRVRSHLAAACVEHEAAAKALGPEHDQVTTAVMPRAGRGQQSVIEHPAFLVEPWALREVELDLERLAQAESVFALANGHIGLRGNLDEGEPSGLLGTYLAGFYEIRPLPYAEAGYGYPEAGQTVVNATNGKIIRLLIDDEPFDIRYGELRGHERVLDSRAGVLRRHVEWVSPTGRSVRVSSTRLVSFTHRAVAAILYEVAPLDRRIPVVVQSELVANEPLPDGEDDPRVAAALRSPLRTELATLFKRVPGVSSGQSPRRG